MDAFTTGEEPSGIPVGVYGAGGLDAPVYLDANFLLGPEAAHLNISGVSGLATKTSASLSWCRASSRPFPPTPAAWRVCFNVKGPDLMFLDQPGDISDLDRRLYQRLGLRPEPFSSVECWAPYKAGVNLNTLRTHPSLTRTPTRWCGDCVRSSTTPRSCSTVTTSMPRPMPSSISWPSAWWEGIRGPLAPRRALRGRSFADLGVLPRHLRFPGGAGTRRRSLAHPSRRHDPEGAKPARQHQHPIQGPGDR